MAVHRDCKLSASIQYTDVYARGARYGKGWQRHLTVSKLLSM